MSWTEQNYRDFMSRRLRDSERAREKMYANRNSPRLPAPVAQPDNGRTLERPAPAEETSGTGASSRLKITFMVRSLRPRDYDNQCCKFLQDRLIEAGILPGDSWDILQGQVISLKAKSREEEGTIVIIETV